MIIKQDRENFHMLNFLDKFMVGHNGYIAGGCFKNIFNGEKIKDIDIFFENATDFDEAVSYFDSMTEGYTGSNKREVQYNFYYENDNVKAYKHIGSGIVLELCRKSFNDAKSMIENFDFTITKFAYFKEEVEDTDVETGAATKHIEYSVLYDDKFFEHLHTNRLVVDDKILFPMSTFERMIRYIKYGYMPCRETKLKIANAIHDEDIENILVNKSLYDGMD